MAKNPRNSAGFRVSHHTSCHAADRVAGVVGCSNRVATGGHMAATIPVAPHSGARLPGLSMRPVARPLRHARPLRRARRHGWGRVVVHLVRLVGPPLNLIEVDEDQFADLAQVDGPAKCRRLLIVAVHGRNHPRRSFPRKGLYKLVQRHAPTPPILLHIEQHFRGSFHLPLAQDVGNDIRVIEW